MKPQPVGLSATAGTGGLSVALSCIMRRLFEFLVHWFLLIGPHPLGVLGASDGGASAGDPPSRMVGQARQSSLMGFFNKVHNEKPTEDNKHPKQLHIPDDDLAPRINHDDPKSARVKTTMHRVHKSVRTSREPTGKPRGRPRIIPFGPPPPKDFNARSASSESSPTPGTTAGNSDTGGSTGSQHQQSSDQQSSAGGNATSETYDVPLDVDRKRRRPQFSRRFYTEAPTEETVRA